MGGDEAFSGSEEDGEVGGGEDRYLVFAKQGSR